MMTLEKLKLKIQLYRLEEKEKLEKYKEKEVDKFLKEVSYKFPKGYPDMKDPQDVKLLNKLVMEYTNEAEDPEIEPQAEAGVDR